MNTWQCLRQLQYLIRQRDWTGSSTVVFASESVKITAAAREEAVERSRLPAVFLAPGGATSDREYPDLIDQEVIVRLAAGHQGDAHGEYAMVGGQRAGQQDSRGRGLLEIEEEVFAAIELLNTDDGVVVQHRASSAVRPEFVSGQYVLFRDYLFALDATADRYYHPVVNFVES